MGGMVSKPKVPKVPKVPTIDEASETREALDKRRRRRGNAASILTGQLGDTSPVQTAAKTLLGS
jgi:hypothetical protein